jgi:hypothetical protein
LLYLLGFIRADCFFSDNPPLLPLDLGQKDLSVYFYIASGSYQPLPKKLKPTFTDRFHHRLPATQVTSYRWRFIASCLLPVGHQKDAY